jgi:hypothetical protein
MLHTACASRSTVPRTEFLPIAKSQSEYLAECRPHTEMLYHDWVLRVAREAFLARYVIQDEIHLATAAISQ